MNTSVLIIGLVMAVIFIVPVLLLVRAGRKKSHDSDVKD
jgi:hypothetical protein